MVKSAMKKEIERCEETLKLSEEGNIVALVSSGDAGVYGMAGIMLEVAGGSDVKVEIVPGDNFCQCFSFSCGSTIMHDHVSISLSNLLTDWELIKKRIALASEGDFVISLSCKKQWKTRTYK